MTSKKDKILKTALELFTEQGFKGTTTKEIAQKSGVAEGLIFYYFKDKNELLNELTRKFSFIGSFQEELKALSINDPNKALVKLGHLYANFLLENKSFLTFIWSPEMLQNRALGEEVVHLTKLMSKEVGIHISRAINVTLDHMKIEMATSMFLSTILTHYLLEERISDDVKPIDDSYIEDVINLILKGLKQA